MAAKTDKTRRRRSPPKMPVLGAGLGVVAGPAVNYGIMKWVPAESQKGARGLAKLVAVALLGLAAWMKNTAANREARAFCGAFGLSLGVGQVVRDMNEDSEASGTAGQLAGKLRQLGAADLQRLLQALRNLRGLPGGQGQGSIPLSAGYANNPDRMPSQGFANNPDSVPLTLSRADDGSYHL